MFFFFFKQKTAYEIASCLVGSEMCIRDSYDAADPDAQLWVAATLYAMGEQVRRRMWGALDAEDADRLYSLSLIHI